MMQPYYKFLFVPFLNIFIFYSTHAQNQDKIDSLNNILITVKADTLKFKILNSLCWESIYIGDYKTAMKNANEEKKLCEESILKTPNEKHLYSIKINLADAYYNIASIYEKQGNYSEALKINFKALEIGEDIADKKGNANTCINIGTNYHRMGNYKEALRYYEIALKAMKEIGDKQGISRASVNIGNVYDRLGNYTEALKYFLTSLKIKEEIGDKRGAANAYHNIGGIYFNQNNFVEALKNYNLSIKIKEEIDDKEGIGLTYSNMGNVYFILGKYSEALKTQLASLKIRLELGDKKGIADNYNNIGIVYREQSKFDESLKNHFASLEIENEIGNKAGITECYNFIGNVYIKTKEISQAIDYLNRSVLIANEIGFKEILIENYKLLAIAYELNDDFRNALKFNKLLQQSKDTLSVTTYNKQISELQAKYELKEKEKEIAILISDKKLQDLEVKKQNLLKNSLLVVLTLSIILLFYIYKNYRTRQKLKLENIRNNIAADLHDDIGSTLNSISLFSEVAKQEAGKPIPALEQIGVSARKIIDAMSDIVWTINPENDTFENVIARMRSLSYMLLKAKAIEFIFKADESLNHLSLPMPVRKNFYLLFKEAINNLVKYSNATRASFHLLLENKNIKMVIRDNGVGFDINNALMGNGIKNMKRRAAEIGAELLIESAEGKGTNIELSFKS